MTEKGFSGLAKSNLIAGLNGANWPCAVTKQHFLVSLWLAFAAVSITGCSGRPFNGDSAPRLPAVEIGRTAIRQCDTNRDGKISGTELDHCPGLKAAVSRLDPSGNGEITAAMITARIDAWQKSKLGRMSYGCIVTRNGKPLEGATVKLVPEKFLGHWITTATGISDKNGQADIAVAVPSTLPAGRRMPRGLPPGFYRVEITKPGEKIPAKYNTKTVLGQEIAMDAGIEDGIRFDLTY